MPQVLRGDRLVHYTQGGEGPGLVLVPGLGSGSKLFGTLPRRFARAGFTCAAVDPVGIEPSSPLPAGVYDFDEAARDVLAVAARLPQPVALVGTSLGGKVALRAASLQPEAVGRLVMLCSTAVVSARARRIYRMFELMSTEVDGKLFGDLIAPFLFGSTFLQTKTGVVDDILRSMRPTPTSRAFMAAQARALQQWDGNSDTRTCRATTLCLAGAEDTLSPPSEIEDTAARIPGARYGAIANAGHSLLLESATAFLEVTRFLLAR